MHFYEDLFVAWINSPAKNNSTMTTAQKCIIKYDDELEEKNIVTPVNVQHKYTAFSLFRK